MSYDYRNILLGIILIFIGLIILRYGKMIADRFEKFTTSIPGNTKESQYFRSILLAIIFIVIGLYSIFSFLF